MLDHKYKVFYHLAQTPNTTKVAEELLPVSYTHLFTSERKADSLFLMVGKALTLILSCLSRLCREVLLY